MPRVSKVSQDVKEALTPSPRPRPLALVMSLALPLTSNQP
jgi:hypothetical protein